VLVGRSSDLETLDRLVDEVGKGHGKGLLVTGEAGIGKSRLVAEIKHRFGRTLLAGQAQRTWLLEGHCFDPDRLLPFAPVLDLLRTFVAIRSIEDVAAAVGSTGSELVKLLPDLAWILPDISPSPPLQPDQEKRRLFHMLFQFVVRLAATQPVLVVVEDLQWSDDSSLDFLLYVARRISEHPVLLVLTCRGEEANPGLIRFLTDLNRERTATELTLSRLTPNDVAMMLQAIFNLPRSVPADLLHVLYTLTDGNPFFIEETLKALISAGDVGLVDGVWEQKPAREWRVPRSVQDSVRLRIAGLSGPSRDILTLAAVAGRRFDFALLRDLAGCAELELLARIKELIAAHLVVEESAEQFAFHHALVRQAIYTQLLARERRTLHGRIAATLERLHLANPDAVLSDLAYHFFEAELWDKTVAYASQAGEQAQVLSAPRIAVEQLTRALDAASHLPIAPSAQLARLRQVRGHAHELLGRFESALEDFQRALALTRQTGDRFSECRCLLDLGSLWTERDYANAGPLFEQAVELAKELGDSPLRASGLNRLGNWLVNVGSIDEGIAAHQTALDLFRTRRDSAGMADTLNVLGMANGLVGDAVAAVEHFGQAIDLFRALGDKRGLASSLAGRVHFAGPGIVPITFSARATLADFEADLFEAKQLTRQLNWPAGQAFLAQGAVPSYASFGDFELALACARETLQLATEIGHVEWTVAAYWGFGATYRLMLSADEAIESLQSGLPLARELRSSWWMTHITAYLALAHVLNGDPERAESTLVAVATNELHSQTQQERLMTWAWGELALARGDWKNALRHADELIGSVPGRMRGQPIPTLLKLRGEALLRLGRVDEARRALEDARSGAIERHERSLVWQIDQSLGRLLQESGRAEEARRTFASARDAISSLAATIRDDGRREQFVTAALGAAREKAPSPNLARKQALGGLTIREGEVASLVAEGRSNREIAVALVVSERTVTTHLSNIFSKLGFTSRAQVAAWSVKKGPQNPT
jgi:tetratricopeptide (TPR) repeat protein